MKCNDVHLLYVYLAIAYLNPLDCFRDIKLVIEYGISQEHLQPAQPSLQNRDEYVPASGRLPSKAGRSLRAIGETDERTRIERHPHRIASKYNTSVIQKRTPGRTTNTNAELATSSQSKVTSVRDTPIYLGGPAFKWPVGNPPQSSLNWT